MQWLNIKFTWMIYLELRLENFQTSLALSVLSTKGWVGGMMGIFSSVGNEKCCVHLAAKQAADAEWTFPHSNTDPAA